MPTMVLSTSLLLVVQPIYPFQIRLLPAYLSAGELGQCLKIPSLGHNNSTSDLWSLFWQNRMTKEAALVVAKT